MITKMVLRSYLAFACLCIFGGLFFCTVSCSKNNSSDPSSDPNLVQVKSEGTSNGGGGKGVDCEGQIQILDLYEARLIGRKLSPSSGSLGQNLISVAEKVRDYFSEPGETKDQISPEQMDTEVEKIFNGKVVFLPKGQSLAPTQDATIPLLPKECHIVQIAVWAVDGHIYIDPTLWNQLDGQNQAALVLHEVIYYSARQSGAINSDEARKLVADFFSPAVLAPKFGAVMNAYHYGWCGAGGGDSRSPIYEFFFADDSQNAAPGVKFYFRTLSDSLMLTQTMGFVANITVQSVFDGTTVIIGSKANNPKRNQDWSFEVRFKPRSDSAASANNRNQLDIVVKSWDKQIPTAKPVESYGFCQLETRK